MKKLLVFTLFILLSAGLYAQSTDEREMSMNDGVMFNGYAMPIGAVKNIVSTGMILGCMDSVQDRGYCQCAVDNTFASLTPAEILRFVKEPASNQDKANEAMQYCSKAPEDKIPAILGGRPMTGGEIRTYLEKETMLDCIEAGQDEAACACAADAMSSLEINNIMQYLNVIDTRKVNTISYVPENSDLQKQVSEIYKECGVSYE